MKTNTCRDETLKNDQQDGNDAQYGHGGFDSDVFQNLVPFSSDSRANLNTH